MGADGTQGNNAVMCFNNKQQQAEEKRVPASRPVYCHCCESGALGAALAATLAITRGSASRSTARAVEQHDRPPSLPRERGVSRNNVEMCWCRGCGRSALSSSTSRPLSRASAAKKSNPSWFPHCPTCTVTSCPGIVFVAKTAAESCLQSLATLLMKTKRFHHGQEPFHEVASSPYALVMSSIIDLLTSSGIAA